MAFMEPSTKVVSSTNVKLSTKRPVFRIEAVDFYLEAEARPLLLAFGTIPDYLSLVGWRLAHWCEARRSTMFGGLHPLFMDGRLPFTPFFEIHDVAPDVVEILGKARYIDLAILDDSADIVENVIFTHADRYLVNRKLSAARWRS